MLAGVRWAAIRWAGVPQPAQCLPRPAGGWEKGAMFATVLIANRGEIACRIIRTARALGLRTIAVASEADRASRHVALADEVALIGPPAPAESYLNGERIIAAAKRHGAEAIHPGYGFLAENAEFAEAVAAAGLVFIGPRPETIRTMGEKSTAKAIAEAAGVPVLPGRLLEPAKEGSGAASEAAHKAAQEAAQEAACEAALETAHEAARAIGFPLMVKAVAGGGGRGMRLVKSEDELTEALPSAAREAKAAFGDARLFLERFVARARHIEVQVMGDRHGNVVHLFERDCSLQRRHQKVVEEAPAPGLSESLRSEICAAAVALAKHVGYEGAGTVEFLLETAETGAKGEAEAEGQGDDDRSRRRDRRGAEMPAPPFHFLEMNTRLQVEHPVTEMITGLDIVEWQFRIAAGESLPRSQEEIRRSGHAIEVRLLAEDPARGFAPSSGRLHELELPESEGLRIDGGFATGDVISPHYDSLIAKIIAHGPSRRAARERLAAALARMRVLGPQCNVAFLARLLEEPRFVAGKPYIGLIAERLEALTARAVPPMAVAAGVAALIRQEQQQWGTAPNPGADAGAEASEACEGAAARGVRQSNGHEGICGSSLGSPWARNDAFDLAPAPRRFRRTFVVDGARRSVELIWQSGRLAIGVMTAAAGEAPAPTAPIPAEEALAEAHVVVDGPQVLVWYDREQLSVGRPDYSVSAAEDGDDGDGRVRAPISGRIAVFHVKEGMAVARGAPIAIIEAMKMEHVVRAPVAGVIRELASEVGAQVREGALLARLESAPVNAD